jgi:ABC-type xylose transport system permease subunit
VIAVLRTIDLRGVLAAFFSLVSAFLWVTVGEVPPPLLAVTCLCVGVVIGVLGARPQNTVPDVVASPWIPEEA